MQIKVFNNITELSEYLEQIFEQQFAQAIGKQNTFSVALSGGNTPKTLYTRLARASLPWQKIHFFWSDERCVPPDHSESNYRMAAETWLQHIPTPKENIHRILGELPPQQAAQVYEQELRTFFRSSQPRFDLVLLGMGEDGHTASIFPGSAVLQESGRWVTEVEHSTPPPPLVSRVTLTLAVLNACRLAVFLVSGAGKAARVAEVLSGKSTLPAGQVRPSAGELLWLLDTAAASCLPW